MEIDRAIERWCGEPFQTGSGDCLLSLADIVRAVFGYDPAREYRDRFTTPLGAARITRKWGGIGGAIRRAAIVHSWQPVNKYNARIGDIGLIHAERVHGKFMAVMKHERLWVGRVPGGFTAIPTNVVIQAWRLK